MKFFTAILSALALTVSTTSATPIDARTELIVVSPQITVPNATTVWDTGSQQYVQWDTTHIPPEAKNYTGAILLGHFEDGSDSEHLEWQTPLAYGFLLTDGKAKIKVPFEYAGKTYFVVLMGDSGNRSENFTIRPVG